MERSKLIQAERVIAQMKALDDDMTDIIILDGEAFQVKRATTEDIEEWRG